MRYLYFSVLFLLLGCSTQLPSDELISPSSYLSQDGADSLLYKLIVKTDKLAPGARLETRDSIIFEDYYLGRMRVHELVNFYKKDSLCYYQFLKVVPSLFAERRAYGGSFILNANGEISELEQVYVSPKMANDSLLPRAQELFKYLVHDKSIQHFEFEKGYIEFPDTLTYYDKEAQRWVSKLEGLYKAN